MKKSLFLFFALLLTPAFGREETVSLEKGGLEVSYEAGFEGKSLSGWFPVFVTLENRGEDRELEIVARLTENIWYGQPLTCEARRTLTLPAGTRQGHVLYLFHKYPIDELTVELRRPGGGGLEDSRRTLHLESAEGMLMTGVLTDPSRHTGLLKYLDGVSSQQERKRHDWGGKTYTVETPIRSASMDPEMLPGRWIGYDGLDLLILYDVLPDDWEEERRRALADWVRLGGRLALIPSARWSGLGSAFLRDLARLEEVRPVSTEGRESGFRYRFHDKEEVSAVVVAGAGSLPLAYRVPVGTGEVILLTQDVIRPPFQRLPLLIPDLWREILEADFRRVLERADHHRQYSGYRHRYYANRGDTGDPRLDSGKWRGLQTGWNALPSIRLVLGILLAYVLIVAPVNFIAVRRSGNSLIPLLTIPVTALVFSGVLLGTGYFSRGGSMRSRVVTLVRPLGEDRRGHSAHAYASVFTAGSRSYDVSFPSRSAPNVWAGQPGELGGLPVSFLQKQEISISDFPSPMWAVRGFQAQGVLDSPGMVRWEGGVLHNDTPFAFEEGFLIRMGKWVQTGPVKPGEPLAVSGWTSEKSYLFQDVLPRALSEAGIEPESAEGLFLLESALRKGQSTGPDHVIFLGRIEKNPFPIEVPEARQELDRTWYIDRIDSK